MSQIVPTLADLGEYSGSESTFYRVLRAASQQHHRGRAKKPSVRVVTSHCATEPNCLWSWGITWLPAAVKERYLPEPEAYAMLLAGLGLVGFIARRKNQLKTQRG